MFNIGGGELLVIMIVALIVLGPQKLPDAARQLGKAMAELRRLSSGFKSELQSAVDDSAEVEARRRGEALKAAPTEAKPIDPGPVRTSPLEPPRRAPGDEGPSGAAAAPGGATGNGANGAAGGNGAAPTGGSDDEPRRD